MVKEAAAIAGVTSRTVSAWHYGYKVSEFKRSKSVFATEREKGRPLSYLELVEVAFVAKFRDMGMPLKDIRTANDYLSKLWSVEYPFGQLKLKTEGRNILASFDTTERYLHAASKGGTMLWDEHVDARIREFTYEFDLAIRWHPRGQSVPVIVDPRLSFGSPILERSGIATWIIRERHDAGEEHDEIADDFGITIADVHMALEFEGVEPIAA
jgi:uncharacterized protein (DUF433 family)